MRSRARHGLLLAVLVALGACADGRDEVDTLGQEMLRVLDIEDDVNEGAFSEEGCDLDNPRQSARLTTRTWRLAPPTRDIDMQRGFFDAAVMLEGRDFDMTYWTSFDEPGFLAANDSYAVRWSTRGRLLMVAYAPCAAERLDYAAFQAQPVASLDAVTFAPEDRINEAVPDSQR